MLWKRPAGQMGSGDRNAKATSIAKSTTGSLINRHQSRACGHQAILTAGTIMQGT
jgi:hypothetical protein